MPAFNPLCSSPATVSARARRSRQRQERVEAGWRDGRYRDPTATPAAPYVYVSRWRSAHRDSARASDRTSKGMKRNPTFKRAWPLILDHYGAACLKCGSTDRVAPDHVLPVMLDPIARNVLANLQPLCRACNSFKRSRSEDYRPDLGAWIVSQFAELAQIPLHPTKRRPRYGHTQFAFPIVHPVDADPIPEL